MLRAFRADLDGDGRVGVLDFSVVVSRFASEGASCAPAGNPATVTFSDGGVQPMSVTVQAGQPVLFVNSGAGTHTATADSGLWNSGLLGGGQSFGYVCGALAGTITVAAPPPPVNNPT
ncbi:MAG: hypothetical protein NTZ05_07605 [Chloroflexi bacterium]|nr:hypothetical protein [Chloroflexota bacterium]